MTPRDASDDSRWSDLDRPPLNGAALRRGLVREGGLWRRVEVVQRTGSTNTDLVDLATAGKAEEGTVLVAEEQTAGRGRLDRDWTAPPRSGLFFSVLLNPAEVPVARWGWLPLLTGVAVATGLSRAAGVDMALKWPNDVLVTVGDEERKTGGILAERAGEAGVVIGVGINVTLRADELPVPQAASLALAGAVSTDRDPLLRGCCGPWRSGTGGGGPRWGIRWSAGCRRRMWRGARRWGRWCGPSCRATGRSPGRRSPSTATDGSCWRRRKACRSRWGPGTSCTCDRRDRAGPARPVTGDEARPHLGHLTSGSTARSAFSYGVSWRTPAVK